MVDHEALDIVSRHNIVMGWFKTNVLNGMGVKSPSWRETLWLKNNQNEIASAMKNAWQKNKCLTQRLFLVHLTLTQSHLDVSPWSGQPTIVECPC